MRNVSRNIPEPEGNRKRAATTTYACEIFLQRKPLTGLGGACIIVTSAARRSSRGRPGAAPADRKASWHTRKRLDGLRLVGGTDWRVGRRTLLLHHVGGRKPAARGPKEPDHESGGRARNPRQRSLQKPERTILREGPPSSGAAPGRKTGRRSLFVSPSFQSSSHAEPQSRGDAEGARHVLSVSSASLRETAVVVRCLC